MRAKLALLAAAGLAAGAGGAWLAAHRTTQPYQTADVLLALSALAIAVLGALLPASWAARSRTAIALHTE